MRSQVVSQHDGMSVPLLQLMQSCVVELNERRWPPSVVALCVLWPVSGCRFPPIGWGCGVNIRTYMHALQQQTF